LKNKGRAHQEGILLERQAGRQAREAFSLAHHGRVYQFVHRSVRNHLVAEDLTSQIFLKVVSGLDEARGAKAAKLWL
jgi:DNA-directed RNA polymerase specialized sigma24 family protein